MYVPPEGYESKGDSLVLPDDGGVGGGGAGGMGRERPQTEHIGVPAVPERYAELVQGGEPGDDVRTACEVYLVRVQEPYPGREGHMGPTPPKTTRNGTTKRSRSTYHPPATMLVRTL